MRPKDSISRGDKFGYWIVKEELSLSRNKARCLLCICKCGTEKKVYYSHLKYGQSKSCGCMQGSHCRTQNEEYI